MLLSLACQCPFNALSALVQGVLQRASVQVIRGWQSWAPGAPDRLVSSPDDLHPSPEGYRLMARALEAAVEELITKMGRLG